MKDILSIAGHRPFPMPAAPWRMRQRWNDLLFAHWPVPKQALTGLLPAGLEVDTFDNWAWVGVVPFHMDLVEVRGAGARTFGVPSAHRAKRASNEHAARPALGVRLIAAPRDAMRPSSSAGTASFRGSRCR